MPHMKRKKSDAGETAFDSESPYPYGLVINLDGESLGKLGLDLLAVGEELKFSATAKVSSVSEHEHEGGGDKNMGLQITHMYVDGDHDGDVAERFYGKGEKK